jgi:hypothetical protein
MAGCCGGSKQFTAPIVAPPYSAQPYSTLTPNAAQVAAQRNAMMQAEARNINAAQAVQPQRKEPIKAKPWRG